MRCGCCNKEFGEDTFGALRCCVEDEGDCLITTVEIKPTVREVVTSIYTQMRGLEADLVKIRESCKHEITHLGEYMWAGPQHFSVCVICDHCDHPVRSADKEEICLFYSDIKFMPVQLGQKQ